MSDKVESAWIASISYDDEKTLKFNLESLILRGFIQDYRYVVHNVSGKIHIHFAILCNDLDDARCLAFHVVNIDEWEKYTNNEE